MIRLRDWELFEDGARAAEELAADLGVPLAKEDPPVLSTQGFEQAVRNLIRKLAKDTSRADEDAIKKMAEELDQDWDKLTEKKRFEVIARAARFFLGVPNLVVGKVEDTLIKASSEMVAIAKRDLGKIHRLKVSPTFNVRDRAMVEAAAKSQGNYLTDRYKNRAFSIEQRARNIVADGLKKGLGRSDIGKLLHADLLNPQLRQSTSYWETLASIHMGRARSIGQISGYEDAGITEFEYEAVLDEVTTDICRFLNGKRFSVAKARETLEAVEKSDDPKGIEQLQPWMRSGKTKDGKDVLFIQRGDRREVIADVHESGVGESDKIGSYSSKHTAASLQEQGICMPPAHPRCRSTTVPVT